jgi:hypothetical protein
MPFLADKVVTMLDSILNKGGPSDDDDGPALDPAKVLLPKESKFPLVLIEFRNSKIPGN